MKRFCIVTGLFAALTCSTIYAQDSTVLKATIPFAFHLGNLMLPAGDYEISQKTGPGILLLRQTPSGRGVGLAFSIPDVRSTNEQEGKLVFHRYGNTYFVAALWRPGMRDGRTLVPCRKEKEYRIASTPYQMAWVPLFRR